MTLFIQLHALTSYPPSNPNRDDLGRPKTATYGDAPRLRISSQAIKRSIRTHPDFAGALDGHLGERTQRLGEIVLAHLRYKGTAEADAMRIAREVGGAFAKIKPEKDPHPARTEQLAFVSPDERRFALDLASRLAAGKAPPKDKALKALLLRPADGAADIAMFGRMLADAPEFNRDAAAQVAHAITTHRAQIEDDYYTAVDDLKRPSEDMGAGFVGEAGFGSGVFYVYACINRDLLVENLDRDEALADRSIKAFTEAFALASPSGKKNSFANHVRADFLLCERGDRQPRTLAAAFLRPVRARGDEDLMTASINALAKQRAAFERAYGRDWREDRWLNARADDTRPPFGEGDVTLADLATFAAGGA